MFLILEEIFKYNENKSQKVIKYFGEKTSKL